MGHPSSSVPGSPGRRFSRQLVLLLCSAATVLILAIFAAALLGVADGLSTFIAVCMLWVLYNALIFALDHTWGQGHPI
jgi:hypothetical protein